MDSLYKHQIIQAVWLMGDIRIVTANPELTTRRNMELLNDYPADLIVADGVGVLWAAAPGHRLPERVTGTI